MGKTILKLTVSKTAKFRPFYAPFLDNVHMKFFRARLGTREKFGAAHSNF